MTLRNNDTQTLTLRKKTIQRFAFILNLLGNGTASNVNLELVDVKCILKRGSTEHVLFHEHLQLLAQESMFFQGYTHALQKDVVSLGNTSKLLPLMVDLGSPLNLMGDDECRLEVTTKTGWYGDFDATQSSMEVEDREIIGVETVIPFIRTRSLQSTLSREKFSLGDNITSLTLLNIEAARTNADSDRIWDGIIITSDKINWNDNRGRLFARRATQFEDTASGLARKESFRYVPPVEIDGVELTLSLNGPNVVAAKNFIVYRTFLATAENLMRADALQQKHHRRNSEKLEKQVA